MLGGRLGVRRTQGRFTQPALGLCIVRVDSQGGLVLLSRSLLVWDSSQHLCQLEVGAGETWVDLEGFAVMRDRVSLDTLARELMCLDLMHARGSGRTHGKTQHRFIGLRRVNPVRHIQDIGIVRL